MNLEILQDRSSPLDLVPDDPSKPGIAAVTGSLSSLKLRELPLPLAPRALDGQETEVGRWMRIKRDAEEAFTPTHTQWITIYCIEIFFVTMLLGWNLNHAIVGTLTGAKVESIMLDANQGGATRMRGGWAFFSLPAGYIGSSTMGAALIFCGFDTYAAKIACIPILFDIALVLWWARKDWFTCTTLLFPTGLLVIFFVVEHSAFLRFYVLWIGIMNVMYAVWDILDDLVFQKIEASDCAHFAMLYPWMPAQAWGTVWFLFAFMALCAGTLGGLVMFKEDFATQQIQAQSFIPT
ncbi:hypothetical protein T439DRAFT_357962 [Meredithblackwellia eburnea MCA 4105]